MDWITMSLKLGAALLAGGVVGFEREISGKAAGIRTNILICVGATVMSMIGFTLTEEATVAGRILSDPQRIGAGIITGIGFLGAGAIIQSRGSVRGLTTAATIWVLAGIGIAIGVGYFELAGMATLTTVATLYGLEKLSKRIAGRHTTVEYAIAADASEGVLDAVQRCVDDVRAEVFGMRIEKTEDRLLLRFAARAEPVAHAELQKGLLELRPVLSLEHTAAEE